MSGYIVYDQFFKDKGDKNTSSDVKDMVNNNSKLPVVYMSKKSEKSIKIEYDFVDNYMSDDYYNNDINFSYYGYPNDESDFYLAYIKLNTNKYNILGVTIGDDISKSVSKIEKYCFSKLKESSDYNIYLVNGDYTITIEGDLENYDEERNTEVVKVGSVSIKAKSEYLGNRVY